MVPQAEASRAPAEHRRPWPLRKRNWVPLLVLLLGLLGTGLVGRQLGVAIDRADHERFLKLTQSRQNALIDRLNNYAALLRATAGMFAANPGITAEGFAAYVGELELARHYPGVQGIGFSRAARGKLAAEQLEADLRALYGGEVGVWPTTPREEYHAIVYLEPVDRRNAAALGYDMFTEPVRHAAMARARDSGTLAASGAVTLVQEIEGRKQSGFLLYMPVYAGGTVSASVEERRERLLGFAYAPFRIGDLFAAIFGKETQPNIGLELYDGPRADPQHRMYRSAVPPEKGRARVLVTRLTIAGQPWTVRYFSLPRFDASSSRGLLPFVAAGGTVLSLLFAGIVAQQIRARVESERREAALRASEASFRQLANTIPQLVWSARADGYVLWFNERWYEYTGTTPEQMAGWGWQSVIDPAVLPGLMERWRTDGAAGRPLGDMIVPLRGADGVFRPFLSRVTPLRNEAGEVMLWFGTDTDISEQQQLAEQRELLIAELNHRVKNTLAIVQSIAQQTRRATDTLEDFHASFLGRLHALARTHDLLTRERWEGASLEDILRETLAPYVHGTTGEEVRAAGPSVRLEPGRAVSLSMAFHELATNAAKYGALSRSGGHVDIAWAIESQSDETTLRIEWLERGGPPVSPPAGRGFGSRLIEQTLARELAGEVSLEFAPGGLQCRMRFPLKTPPLRPGR